MLVINQTWERWGVADIQAESSLIALKHKIQMMMMMMVVTIKRYCVGHAVVIVTVGVDALSCFGDGRFFNCTEQNEIFEVYRAMSSHLSIMPGSSWKSFLAASSISLSPSTPTLFSTIILQSCTEVLLSKSMKFTTICLFFCSVFKD